ncbi:NAD(P)-dependent oxidoreductase, partial [Candidatus Gottesmanbacteria bacterium]|nr:NAD(P)-dependent oxidoreductase [Candidatus Gottesmanbacteria bacterium]
LRIFGLFGPGEDYRLRFISNLIVRALSGQPLVMSQDAYFDYVWIRDFVRIVEHFIQHEGKYRAYNIGTGKRYRLSDIARKIIAISGSRETLQIKKKGFNKEYTCDNARLMRELRGFRFTDFSGSLQELYTWYKKRKQYWNL